MYVPCHFMYEYATCISVPEPHCRNLAIYAGDSTPAIVPALIVPDSGVPKTVYVAPGSMFIMELQDDMLECLVQGRLECDGAPRIVSWLGLTWPPRVAGVLFPRSEVTTPRTATRDQAVNGGVRS